MQTMYNESDSQSITKYTSPGSSRSVAENAPVKRVQSELAAPITNHPPPPAPLPVDLLAIGWHEGFGLMSALDSLISYQPPYITTSNQTHIVLTRRTPATCPNSFIPDANLKTLVDHIDTIRPMLRKLYDAVFVGVRGLMDIQAEAEKLKPVNFRTGEVERVQGVQTWQDVAREMDRLLDEVADTIGFNFP
jgi:hypothetical protein